MRGYLVALAVKHLANDEAYISADADFEEPVYDSDRFFESGLVFGTLVETPNGKVPVEDLQVGDFVLASDGRLHRLTVARHWTMPKAVNIHPIRFEKGVIGNSETISALPFQKICVNCDQSARFFGAHARYVEAQLFTNGSSIRSNSNGEHRFVELGCNSPILIEQGTLQMLITSSDTQMVSRIA